VRLGIRRRWNLPRSGIDCTDRGAGDIGILQGIDVEIKILDSSDTVGQGAQHFPELPGLSLRLGHTDGLETKAKAGGYLRENRPRSAVITVAILG